MAFAVSAGMLRITPHDDPAGTRRLELSGRVAGPWVAELRRAVEEACRRAPRVALDLRGVTYVGADGAGELRALRARGVVLEGGSPFVAELVGEAE